MNDVDPRSEWLQKPGGLAERLRTIRARAFPSGSALAQALGWSQSTVSRLESGSRPPRAEQVTEWVRACDGTQDEIDELISMIESGRLLWVDWKRHLRNGQAPAQRGVTDLIEASDRICYFETAVVAGPLQTASYTRALLAVLTPGGDPADLDAATTSRMARQQHLYDPSKRWELLMDESVLHRWPDNGSETTEMMRSQIDRIYAVVGMSNVRVGFLPLHERLSAWPQSAFAIYDDMAVVETAGGEVTHTGPVANTYVEEMGRLWSVAIEDAEGVRQLLGRALASTE